MLFTVDLDAIVKNALYVKSQTNAKVCAVVKSDAYGHGATNVVRVLRDVADCFAVGSIAEALQISSYVSNILVLLPIFEKELTVASKCGFVLTIDSFDTLDRYAKSGLPLVCHVKIDSGMGRLGFSFKQLPQLYKMLQSNKKIYVNGVYSHFFSGDKESCDKQLACFLQCADYLENKLGTDLVKHIASTKTIFADATYHLDMVRVGLGLYGYGTSNLRVAKTVYSRVLAAKKVCKGQRVGYDGVFRPTKDTCFAVVDTGYANGFTCVLRGSKILVEDKFATVVAVCMGMLICDTADRLAKVGSLVTLLGNGVNPSNCNTSVYELLSNLR